MEKVTGQKTLLYFSDADNLFEIDFYHCMFSYWLIKYGSGNSRDLPNDHTYMYPSLVNCSDISKKMVTGIRKLGNSNNSSSSTVVKELNEFHTGNSFRIGAINTIAANSTCNLVNVVSVSGHDTTNICAAFEYLSYEQCFVARGCRALSGYPDVAKKVKSPKLSFLDPNNQAKVIKMISNIVPLNGAEFQVNGRLWNFVETCAATFILYFPRLIDKYRAQHRLVTLFKEKMILHNISAEEIRSWSSIIQHNFINNQQQSRVEQGENPSILRLETSQIMLQVIK